MLGWLFPRCPISTRDKVWVERRMLWLADRFGIDRLKDATVVLPTPEFFPDPYHGDEASARTCFTRVCRYMGVEAATVSLDVADEEQMPGAAGLYEQHARSNIVISRSQLDRPPHLLATLAHELAHELLLKGGHLSRETHDHEQVTDLLPVFLGMGIFAANTTVESQSVSYGPVGYFSISRQGYLSSVVLGYALAVFAYMRGERSPPWARHLRTDARVSLREGLRYLRRTGDTIIAPTRIYGEQPPPRTEDVIAHLAHRSPTFRFSALWDVFEMGAPPGELLEPVTRCIKDSDQDVQSSAVVALGVFGEAARGAIPELIQASWYGTERLRIAAVRALGVMAASPEQVVPGLAAILSDGEPAVVAAAATALARFGHAAEPAVPRLLESLGHWASVNIGFAAESLVAALRSSCPDSRKRVALHFEGRDPDVRRLVLSLFRDHEP